MQSGARRQPRAKLARFRRSNVIRFVASLLAALLLALGLALGGYCALLAWRRPALAADAPPAPPPIAPIPEPARLPSSPDYGTVALAACEQPPAARIPITVSVRNVPAEWRTPTSGIAITLQDGSSGLVWLPLAAATNEDGVLVLPHVLPQAGEIVVALASAPQFATHSYLARSTVVVPATTTVELDGSAAAVTFRLPAGAKHSCPLRVRRTDDASWLPMDGAAAGLEVGAGAPARLWLGNGSYELGDPLRPEVRQGFVVPNDTSVEVTACSSPARVDRP